MEEELNRVTHMVSRERSMTEVLFCMLRSGH